MRKQSPFCVSRSAGLDEKLQQGRVNADRTADDFASQLFSLSRRVRFNIECSMSLGDELDLLRQGATSLAALLGAVTLPHRGRGRAWDLAVTA